MSDILIAMVCFTFLILFALVGAGIGYIVASKQFKEEPKDSLSKEELDEVRQILNLLTFTGEPQKRRDE